MVLDSSVAWLQLEDLSECRNCFVVVALAPKGVAEDVVGPRVVRLQLDAPAECLDGNVVFALLQSGDAQAPGEPNIVGCQLDALAVHGQGLVQSSPSL